MKYFVVTSTIKDGEFEYLQQTPVMASTQIGASKQVEKDNEEWCKGTYREYDINSVKETTEEEFKILSKYIY